MSARAAQATVIRLADNLVLPLETVTQSIAILAKRRAGKSYTARRIAEELLTADQQVVIIDPKGDWWGIRSSADGKGPGFPVVILGGEHGDLPLEKTAADTVARLIVEERVSVLLDLSEFRKGEVSAFMGGDLKARRDGLLELMYRLKARQEFQTPVMLIVDEADAIAPQKPYPGEERMLGALEDIVRRGGQRGIGTLLISQRSAVINKNVLTQTQVMIAMRTIAPQDLAAMRGWIREKHLTDEVMESIPSLPIGGALVLSPGWPSDNGIFERIQVLPIRTFDSGATPKPGEQRIKPRNLADVDLGALQTRMAETIERAKADDPKELRLQIAELKARLVKNGADERAIESAREFGKQQERAKFKTFLGSLRQALESALQILLNEEGLFGELKVQAPVNCSARTLVAPPRPRVEPRSTEASESSARIPAGERAILTACAQYWETGCAREQLTILTGYKRSSRDAYIQRLVQKELVRVGSDGSVFATDDGRSALGPDFQPLPVGEALAEWWLSRLPEGERKILQILIGAGGREVDREQLSQQTGYQRSSRDAYLQRLGARKLVDTSGRGVVRASGVLFA